MLFAVCPATGMGMSHMLLSSWLNWEDTEQKGGWKQRTGHALWGAMELLGFPGLSRARVLRASRRSRKDFRVGQTSSRTQHELNVKRAQKDWGNAQPCRTSCFPLTVYICHLYANTRGRGVDCPQEALGDQGCISLWGHATLISKHSGLAGDTSC